jgi:hypothetical protein
VESLLSRCVSSRYPQATAELAGSAWGADHCSGVDQMPTYRGKRAMPRGDPGWRSIVADEVIQSVKCAR